MDKKIFEQLRKVKIMCKTAMVCNRSILGEFEAEFKKASARESWAQGVLFDEKKPRVENLVTLSL
jgi:hypothetical protein